VTDYGLTPQQLVVICALSSGATAAAAAEEAGVHRNTIANWRRNIPPFQTAFAHAQYDRALFFREKMETLVDLALQSIQQILADPKTAPSVRLKAALAILNAAATAPQPHRPVEFEIEKMIVKRNPFTVTQEQFAKAPVEPPPPASPKPPVHNPAQSPAPTPPPPPSPAPVQPTETHNSAQPARRETPKISRNHPCPCGSGLKHKRCCLNKPRPAAATAQTASHI
jgi:outer membrane biosynthesis protein TonB